MTDNLDVYEEKARALLDAYQLGTPEALERHYRLTWHRRAWPAMRTYVQLDLGKRPTGPDDNVDISFDDARYLIAMEHGFSNWDELVNSRSVTPDDSVTTAGPMRLLVSVEDDAEEIAVTRDWKDLLRIVAENPSAVIDANGQMTDDMLDQLTRVSQTTVLRLGNSKSLSDAGIRHLARLPGLRDLDLSSTGITDRGLETLSALPNLESLSLVMTPVTDAGMLNLENCHQLRRLNLMWTRTGDGAIRALAGKENFTHLWSGNGVTDNGLAALHELPQFAEWRGGDAKTEFMSPEATPNQLTLRGPFTDDGMKSVGRLKGLFALSADDESLRITGSGIEHLIPLPNLGSLSVNAKDDWMPHIAQMRSLRHLGIQDTTASDDGFEALSKSQSIEHIWGRRCHNLRHRGFVALSKMPKLRGLSVSCLNVDDAAIATLPDFPALRELMPMDIPDAGYSHIGKCDQLEVLTLMYCRDTTDAATGHITGLRNLKRYFNSYTTITDRTPQLLSTMDSLERIELVACNNLTDAGVASLVRLPKLREVRVSGRGVTRGVGAPFPARVRVRYSP